MKTIKKAKTKQRLNRQIREMEKEYKNMLWDNDFIPTKESRRLYEKIIKTKSALCQHMQDQ